MTIFDPRDFSATLPRGSFIVKQPKDGKWKMKHLHISSLVLSVVLLSVTSDPALALTCQETLQTTRSQLVQLQKLSLQQQQDLQQLKIDNVKLMNQYNDLSTKLINAQNETALQKQQKKTALIIGLTIGASITAALTGALIYVGISR